MLPFLAAVPAFLAIITVIITVHELGHFLTARACGIAVDRFSIGFGPTLWARRDKAGVEWRVAWLPLGGYVRFAGDDNVASVPDAEDLDELRRHIVLKEGVGAEKRYFFFKPLWQRALVVLAGPAINFVLSIALFAGLVGAFGEWTPTLQIDRVEPGTGAARAGLMRGDTILAVDGQGLASYDDFQTYVRDRPETPMKLTIQRAGHVLDIAATSGVQFEKSPAGGVSRLGLLGVESALMHRTYGPIAAVGRGAQMTWGIVAKTGHYLGRVIEGKIDWPFSGVIGTAHVTGTLTQEAVDISATEHVSLFETLAVQYVYLAALLSTSIGLVNLLPIPILDGGHLLFYGYEAVARRPLPAGAQAAGYRVGLALLVGLMLFTAWHDLQGLQVFHFLGHLFS
jgi:regulator of sigma E protease